MNRSFPDSSMRRWYFLLVLIALAWSLLQIINHQSSSTAVFGRYSTRYGAAVMASVGIALGWVVIFLLRDRLWKIAGAMPVRVVFWLLLFSGIATATAWWFLQGVEGQLLTFLSTNWLLVAFFLTLALPPQKVGRGWLYLIAAWCGLLVVLFFITALSTRDYSPDEAIWAAKDRNWTTEQRLYRDTLLEPTYRITPGLGWSNLIHSYGLELAFRIETGRAIHFAYYLLALVFGGLLARLLYGNTAALLTLIVMILARVLFALVDYRPDHYIGFASMLIFYMALLPRIQGGKWKSAWHFLTGLFATLSLQIHASGLAFAVGVSLFYALEFFWELRRKSMRELLPSLFAFAAGALIGTGIFWFFNVQSVGGLDVYLGSLLSERGSSQRSFKYLRFMPIEALLVIPAFLLLLIRRERRDVLYLGLVICSVIGITLIDTQGYETGYRPMLFIPVGGFLIWLLTEGGKLQNDTRRQIWAALWIVIALSGYAFTRKVDLPAVQTLLQTGQLRPHTTQIVNDAIMPMIRENDVVVGGIELVWGMHYRDFISFAAEGYQMSYQHLDDGAVFWESVAPDVIVFVPQREALPPGLQRYMELAEYQLCEAIQVRGQDIEVYRQYCADALE